MISENGYGKITFDGGALYEGELQNGVPDGYGKYTFASGDSYEGEFVNGKFNGKGKYTFASGSYEDGEWSNDEFVFGEYKHVFVDSSYEIWNGKFINNKLNGIGKWKSSCGDFYNGEFINDKRHGKGKYTFKNGNFYEGEFVNNEFHGKGKYTFANGRYKDGKWSNGEFVFGEYKHVYDDGSYAIDYGKFINGKLNGIGKWKSSSDDSYEGEFVNNEFHGKGKYTFASGDFYEGEFVNGEFHGYGKYISADGNIYDGEFRNGKIVESDNQNKGEILNSKEQDDNMDNPLNALEELVGLRNVKKEVQELINFAKMQQLRKSKNLATLPISKHLIFSGNPGTGKTTVARIISQIYKEIGLLSKGHLVEVDRGDLVGEYIGHTAIKTKGKIDEAFGGVLFIDEAYTLSDKGERDFGQEAIDTILKAMEDNRDDFVVIVAGYTELMQKFIDSNPGLKSRFNKTLFFEDYTPDDLYEIFIQLCEKNQFQLTDQAKDSILNKMNIIYNNRDKNFANARDVRNLFERIIRQQASRVMSMPNISLDDLTLIQNDDVINS